MRRPVRSALILDTNLLVLLVVGMTSRAYISRHKRLRSYLEADFDLLTSFVVSAGRVIVTPNTLTETSNLLRQIAEPARTHICEQFRRLIRSAEEHYLDSKSVVQGEEFGWFGLTDSCLLRIRADDCELLTADSRLYSVAISRGVKATNFHHHRRL